MARVKQTVRVALIAAVTWILPAFALLGVILKGLSRGLAGFAWLPLFFPLFVVMGLCVGLLAGVLGYLWSGWAVEPGIGNDRQPRADRLAKVIAICGDFVVAFICIVAARR